MVRREDRHSPDERCVRHVVTAFDSRPRSKWTAVPAKGGQVQPAAAPTVLRVQLAKSAAQFVYDPLSPQCMLLHNSAF
jgi:hypothetical protein